MADYLTAFILWDSRSKDIILILTAFFTAQLVWLAAAKIFPALRRKNSEGEPLYMPLPRVLILCAVFTLVYLPLATPQQEEAPEISIEKTVITPPQNGEEHL